jgi:glycosyltransferase involved in cell wall biosynthesis
MGELAAPEVSVVVPTLDRWPMLRRALGGALGQAGVELEAVVVDDGSTDGTSEHVAALGDARVRLVRHDRPQGVARARNAGLEAARGEWVAFLDDDDTWAPAKLAEQLAAARAAQAGWAFSSAVVVDQEGRVSGLDPAPDPRGLIAGLLRHNSIPGGCSNVLARRELVVEAGAFDERLSMLADWDLWIGLAERSAAAACSQPHVGYLDHLESMHVRQAHVTPHELALLADKHRELLARHGIRPDARLWAFSWAAEGEHRAGHRLRAARLYGQAAVQFRSKGMLARALVAPFTDRLVLRDTTSALAPLETVPAWATAPVAVS